MKNLLRLTKINFLTFFSNFRSKTANTKKNSFSIILILFAFGYLGYYLYFVARFILKGLILLNASDLLLPMFMAFVSMYLLLITVFRVNKTVFDSKDYDILLSLPLKKTTIISSKILVLYLSNCIYSLLFMIPAYIAYVMNVSSGLTFNIYFFLSLIFIPLVPTMIGALLGTLLTGISSNFKYKNLVNIVISLAMMVIIIYFSYKANTIKSIDMANMGKSFLNILSKYYPLTKFYSYALDGKFIYLCLYILISVAFYQGYKYLVVNFFDKINSKLKGVTIINKYDDKKTTIHSSLTSLYRKEIKKYFSSSLYVLNTGIGSLMLIMMVGALIIMGGDKLGALLEIENFNQSITLYGPVILGAFCVLSCTTYPSISLEGKNFWILKILPVDVRQIFIAKILVNFTILVPTIIISSIALTILLKLSFMTLILLIITPLMYAFFIAAFGLLINLIFPDLTWNNEVKVIKQSLSSFITIMFGLIIAILPITLEDYFNPNYYSFVIFIIMFILNIILYYVLFTYGIKKFKKI